MKNNKSIKAIGLLSGGLDSTLAVKMMMDQGIDVTVLNFGTIFCTCTRKGCKHEARKAASIFNIPIKVMSSGREYIDVIKNPKYGYGRNMNPCIDCRIFMFRKAKKFMEENGASFIFTGEVLGQRPMSQYKKALRIIEKESDLENLIVRPLSAKLFTPTIPELNNWVNREEMLSIQGRRRLPQMELAKEFGISDYPCPAGGCRLTDPNFAKRLKESFKHGEVSIKDIQLLKYGRHFRLDSGAKVIVGRNEEENNILLRFVNKKDVIIEVKNFGSPIAILKYHKDESDIKIAADLCFRYSDAKDTKKAEISIRNE
jgi:tRNA U34 2-thiouridine synthase MnmA/TrmU